MEVINENQNEKLYNENYFDRYEDKEKETIINKSKFIKKKVLNNSPKYFWFAIFGLSYYFYFISLEPCLDGEAPCSIKHKWIKKKVIQEIISGMLLALMIQKILFKKISKIHFIHIIIVNFFFYCYSHGTDFDDHGYFNFIFYFILVAVFIIALFPLNLMIFCFKRSNNIKILFIYLGLYLFFIILFYFYLFKFKSNCSDWTKGLNNTSLDNNSTRHGCKIQIPKICAFKIFENVQDYTKISGTDCKNFNNKYLKEKLLKNSHSRYISKKSKRIGYPLTNKVLNRCKKFSSGKCIFKYVLNNLVDMDNKKILNKYFKNKIPEIQIDFSDHDKGKLIVDIKFNKTLSDERKLIEKVSEPYSNNILLLYIDSLSRANAIRQLKKTMNFFEKFMDYKGGFNKKYPNETFHSFQFFKYHSFKGYTFHNYPLLFYGQKNKNRNKDSITKFLKENGYVTCNVHDYCEIDNTNTFHKFKRDEVFDHQYLSCDPNEKFTSANYVRCLYGKQNIEHYLNYIEQFWIKYKDNRRYASLIINHGHEGTLNVIKYQDEIIANFLNKLFDDNFLKHTAVILLSDHGVSMPSIYYLYDFYITEYNLPSFFIIINDRKNISYEKQYGYIKENQQTFITAFDIYNTIGNIIYGDKYDNIPNKTIKLDSFKSNLGISLFNKINSKERFPGKYSNFSSISLTVCS